MTVEADAKPIEPTSRKAVAKWLEEAIQEARRKIDSGRVYDATNERVRIDWMKALARLINCHRKVLKDAEIEELKQEVEEIKKNQGCSNCQ